MIWTNIKYAFDISLHYTISTILYKHVRLDLITIPLYWALKPNLNKLRSMMKTNPHGGRPRYPSMSTHIIAWNLTIIQAKSHRWRKCIENQMSGIILRGDSCNWECLTPDLYSEYIKKTQKLFPNPEIPSNNRHLNKWLPIHRVRHVSLFHLKYMQIIAARSVSLPLSASIARQSPSAHIASQIKRNQPHAGHARTHRALVARCVCACVCARAQAFLVSPPWAATCGRTPHMIIDQPSRPFVAWAWIYMCARCLLEVVAYFMHSLTRLHSLVAGNCDLVNTDYFDFWLPPLPSLSISLGVIDVSRILWVIANARACG